MAGRGPQSFKKRQKEQQRKEKQLEKAQKRVERKTQPKDSEEDDLVVLDRPLISARIYGRPRTGCRRRRRRTVNQSGRFEILRNNRYTIFCRSRDAASLSFCELSSVVSFCIPPR